MAELIVPFGKSKAADATVPAVAATQEPWSLAEIREQITLNAVALYPTTVNAYVKLLNPQLTIPPSERDKPHIPSLDLPVKGAFNISIFKLPPPLPPYQAVLSRAYPKPETPLVGGFGCDSMREALMSLLDKTTMELYEQQSRVFEQSRNELGKAFADSDAE